MLVLSRKTGESIMIGDDIEITLVSTEGSKVRIGSRRRPDVPVHRKEIYLEIQASAQDPKELVGPEIYQASSAAPADRHRLPEGVRPNRSDAHLGPSPRPAPRRPTEH